jgi:hypothetical protein
VRPWILRLRSVQASAGALGVAVMLVAGASWRATHQTLPAVADSDPITTRAGTSPVAPSYGLDRLMIALEKDPFHPERRRPARRFQLPQDQATLAARRLEEQTTAVSLRLIGTAVRGDGGGFAMCAWQGGSARIVRIGDHVGTWTLTKVTPGAAEFATPGGSVVVHVAKAGT